MLACGNRCQGHLDVRDRDGQVDHDLDVRVVQDGVGTAVGLDPVLLGLVLGRLRPEVADRDDLQVGEALHALDVGVGDHSGADHTNSDSAHSGAPSPVRNV
jgi:hypothetical protein